jgi:hypothetical protein
MHSPTPLLDAGLELAARWFDGPPAMKGAKSARAMMGRPLKVVDAKVILVAYSDLFINVASSYADAGRTQDHAHLAAEAEYLRKTATYLRAALSPLTGVDVAELEAEIGRGMEHVRPHMHRGWQRQTASPSDAST